MNQLKVAILYQSKVPPAIDGIVKPIKEGGYSDSGADIAMALKQKQIEIITPVKTPTVKNDFDWVFADTEEGIGLAIELGANLFWLNTVLYTNHPILKLKNKNLLIVGQDPQKVEMFDDKFYTNNLLRENSLPIPKSFLIAKDVSEINNLEFPFVIKPIRGRGSQGVSVVYNHKEFDEKVFDLISAKIYGTKIMVEDFLPGNEITLTIMPPGNYTIKNKKIEKNDYWTLPVVGRFNHENDIAPYNGIVAVVNNSKILSIKELESTEIQNISQKCEFATSLIVARAPIRIDCRKNKKGKYYIFDLNLKPNMTGASRPHREDQDSLTMIAAKGIGWEYPDLIQNIVNQHWKL